MNFHGLYNAPQRHFLPKDYRLLVKHKFPITREEERQKLRKYRRTQGKNGKIFIWDIILFCYHCNSILLCYFIKNVFMHLRHPSILKNE
jgi:hypothetical protein